jgi:hypothetical protein
MSSRQSKKQRQFFKREFKKEMLQKAQQVGESIGNILKPRPKWIPEFIWIKLLGIFIRIQK